MAWVLFINVTVNIIVFSGLGVLAWFTTLRNPSGPLSSLARALFLASWAFVLGTVTDLAVSAVQWGLLPGEVEDFVVSPWSLSLSVVAAGLGITALFVVGRLAPTLRTNELIQTTHQARNAHRS